MHDLGIENERLNTRTRRGVTVLAGVVGGLYSVLALAHATTAADTQQEKDMLDLCTCLLNSDVTAYICVFIYVK